MKINNYAKKEDYVFDLIQKIGSLPEKDQEKFRTSCRVMVYDYNDMFCLLYTSDAADDSGSG